MNIVSDDEKLSNPYWEYYEFGYRANQAGLSIIECPYTGPSEYYWKLGWNHAELDTKRQD